MQSLISISRWVLVAAFAARLFLLGGEIDIPDWRQADTGYMALRMMREWPPEVLRPKAPYRGTNDVKAAEFPIYPLVVSLGYRAAGGESFPVARAITLLFFFGSTVYLGLACARLWGEPVGWVAAALYAVLPLGVPYSRMIHPDFCVMFFANAFFYHAVMLLQCGRVRDYALAAAYCSGLFLMKAPYGFYYGFPLGVLALQGGLHGSIRRLAILASLFVLPLALGLWFNDYRIRQEAPFDESAIYPMKWTAESLNARFFGTIAQRFELERWLTLLRKVVILAASPGGLLLALLGLGVAGADWRDRRRWVLWSWAGGMLAYALLVFPMVSSDHDYYVIPFMVFVAAAGACAIDSLARRYAARAVYAAALALMLAGCAYGLRRGPFLYGPPYFTHDWQRIAAGQAIRAHTEPQDLVLAVTLGRSTGWSDPRILWRADRIGWAIELGQLTPELLAQYRANGARWAAVLATAEFTPPDASLGVFNAAQRTLLPLNDPNGAPIGSLTLIDLDTSAP